MIDETIALKVRDTVRAGLIRGLGKAIPGQMCVEAARAAKHAAEHTANRDEFLAKAAEDVVQILIVMNAPGVRWLYLTESK